MILGCVKVGNSRYTPFLPFPLSFHICTTLQTVLQYHEAARRYGMVKVETACKQWLLHNLLTQVQPSYLNITLVKCAPFFCSHDVLGDNTVKDILDPSSTTNLRVKLGD